MAQGALPFKYVEQRQCGGMTALAGLPVYLDLAHVGCASQWKDIWGCEQVVEGGLTAR